MEVVERNNTVRKNLTRVLKDFKHAFRSYEKVESESKEANLALRDFAPNFDDEIEEVILGFANTLDNIENRRLTMEKELLEDFVGPLENLVQDWDEYQDIISEEEKTIKTHAKAKSILEKKRMKFQNTPEKLKPGELDDASKHLTDCFNQLKEKHEQRKMNAIGFQQKKKDVLIQVLQNYIKIQGKFHQICVDALIDAHESLE
jgi:hypothetical protein